MANGDDSKKIFIDASGRLARFAVKYFKRLLTEKGGGCMRLARFAVKYFKRLLTGKGGEDASGLPDFAVRGLSYR